MGALYTRPAPPCWANCQQKSSFLLLWIDFFQYTNRTSSANHMAYTTQPVSVACQNHLAWLCDSVRVVLFPSIKGKNTVVLWAEIGVLLSKGMIEPVIPKHIRLLQRWLYSQGSWWAWRHNTQQVPISPACHCSFSLWSDLHFL